MDAETETPSERTLPASDTQTYFRAIESFFIAVRGAPLLLSPTDWHVARKWYEQGIPLEVVKEAIKDLFERRRAQGKEDKVRDLRYCKRSVAAAWKRRLELEAPAHGAGMPSIDVGARLVSLAAALPDELAAVEGFRGRILALEGAAEQVEARLDEIDREVLKAVLDQLSEPDREELDRDLAAALKNLARRLPESELAGAEAQLQERLLRSRSNLPVLSLFAPEATAS